MEVAGRCDSCGESRMVLDAIYGVLACDACGRVGNQAEAELRSEFQTGHVIERQGTFVGEADTGAGAAKSLMRGQMAHGFYAGYSKWSDRYKVETMKKVEHITALLRVPGDKVDRVKHLLDSTLDGDWGTGRWVDILVAACVYIVIRQSQLPLTVPEVADCVCCDVIELGRMYNRVLHKLEINLPNVDSHVFLERAVSTLPALTKLGKDMVRKITRQGSILLEYAEQWFITTGRRPLPVVAAVLQLVMEANKVAIGLPEVARELHAGICATRLRYKECEKSLVGIAQSLPWGKDVTLKTVPRHLPFLLQYLELKMKLQKQKQKASPPDHPGLIQESAASPRARASATFNVNDCLTSRGNSIMDQRHIANGGDLCEGTLEGRPAKMLKMSVGYQVSEQAMVWNDCEVSFADNNPSKEDHCGVEISDFTDNPQEIVEEQPSAMEGSMATETASGSLGVLEQTQLKWDPLPVAFCASQEARARRRTKILLAKNRVFEARKALAEKFNNTSILSAPPGPVPIIQERLQADFESSDKVTLDWEDLIIEHLLLCGANEVELENGYYQSLLARYPEHKETDDLDDNLSEYLRSRSEVEYLTELASHREKAELISEPAPYLALLRP